MRRWIGLVGLLAAGLAGCSETPSPSPSPPPPTTEPTAPAITPSRFDSASAGVIRGRVTWDGPVPVVPPFEVCSVVLDGNPGKPRLLRDNPHAPVVDPAIHGVSGVVIFLRGVDPQRARPWDHAHVTVEHRDRQMSILQGTKIGRVGFVRRGDAVTVLSREPCLNGLHARGAEFFTLMLPDPDRPLQRVLHQGGRLDLSSAAGWYWMHGSLFVDDHPYYTCSDGRGEFVLPQVPPGRYQVVCWLPNWQVAERDRDPESALVIRVRFRPAVEIVHDVVVEHAGQASVHFSVAAQQF
jgi:hypothetical protein